MTTKTITPATCPNKSYTWHRVDGYCKECSAKVESDAKIQARRNAQGYR